MSDRLGGLTLFLANPLMWVINGLVAEDLPGAGACEVSVKDGDGTITDFIGPDGVAELVASHDQVVTF